MTCFISHCASPLFVEAQTPHRMDLSLKHIAEEVLSQQVVLGRRESTAVGDEHAHCLPKGVSRICRLF